MRTRVSIGGEALVRPPSAMLTVRAGSSGLGHGPLSVSGPGISGVAPGVAHEPLSRTRLPL